MEATGVTTSALPAALALPFLAAAIAATAGRRLGRATGWILLAAAAGSFALLASLPGHGEVASFHRSWLPAIGVDFALRADPFGRFFAMLVTGVGVAVVLYAIAYMADADERRMPRFWGALGAFMGAMVGISLADDLVLLFLFWEVTSISSFLLIGHQDDEARARSGAQMALQVTALGGLVMSVGFLLVGQVTGTFSPSAIASDPAKIAAFAASPLATPALLLVLVGVFTKSAQVPFHFWLPRAMVAPTPVSAYLHAATMVKAGIFLLGRIFPFAGALPAWTPVLATVGATTMLLGAWQAFHETDLKAVLARTTGSMLGFLVLLYGIGAVDQDGIQVLSHALYKGALFLVVGIVDHAVHSRDLRQLGGLRAALPLPFVACAVAALSMGGIPPLLGFAAKEAGYAAIAGSARLDALFPGAPTTALAATLAANALVAAVAARIVVGTFLGRPSELVEERLHGSGHHVESPPLWISPLALASGALALGLLAAGPFTSHLAGSISSQRGAHPHVSIVPEAGLPLALSVSGIALAAVLYALRGRIAALRERWAPEDGIDRAWEEAITGIATVAETVSGRWQNGSLRRYLLVTLLAVPALAWGALRTLGLSYQRIAISLSDMPWYGLVLCVLLGVATVMTVRATTRLQAAIGSTAIGFLVSMLFVVYRSPDILLTQVLIETVSTIFVLLVLRFMPQFPQRDLDRTSRILHLAVAGAFSLAIVVLLLLAMTPGLREPLNIATRPGGLLSLALARGGGANAVNVIIVDIRAMDTNGEITVLVAVGLCIYGLLRARRARSAAS